MFFKEKIDSFLAAVAECGLAFHSPSSLPAAISGNFGTAHYPAESHSGHIEIIHLCKGAAAVQINHNWTLLDTGKPQIFLRNTLHTEHFLHREQDYELFWLSVNPFSINLHTTSYDLERGYRQSLNRQSLQARQSSELWNCIKNNEPDKALFLSLLLDCLYEHINLAKALPEDYNKAAVELVCNYLSKYYAKNLKIADLAAMSHYSEGHLNAIFKEEKNMTIYQYLREIRMKKAAEMLKGGNCRVADVANACGFQDALYFSRCFKNYYGLAPSLVFIMY